MRLPALTLFCLLAIISTLQAQLDQYPPIALGKIPAEDLAMTVYDRDTSAEAVVLCDFETVEITLSVGDVLVRKMRHKRIKILKESGFKFGDVEVPYYSYKKSEEFFFNKAYIHLPDGSIEKLNKKAVFDEKVNDYWSTAKFTFPKMEVGCIVEYVYYINSDRFYEPEDWFFQGEIPVRHSEIRVAYPGIFDYHYLFQGNESMKLVESVDELNVFEGSNGKCTIRPGKFIFENAPAMRPEGYITTMNDYRARVRFQLSSIKRSDGSVNRVTDSWTSLTKELEDSEYFGRHYLRKGYYKEITEPLSQELAALPNEYEKAVFAYNYVTQKVSWNGRHSMYGGAEKLEDLFEKGSGNSAQINLMLLVLLQEAGIYAGPVLTSTRSHGKMFEDYPILDQFNHMLILASIDGKSYYLDATEPLRPIGFPDIEALNSRGWHIKRGWMNIKEPGNSVDAFTAEYSLSQDGTLSGSLLGAYNGYNAVPERRHYIENREGKHWSDRLSEKFTDVKIESVSTGNLMELDQTFSDTVQFQIEQAAMVAGELMYFSPVLYTSFTESPFKQKERNYPVDIPYSIREQHNIKVALPEGYALEEAPESVRVVLPRNGGAFLYAVEEQAPGELTVNINLSIKQLHFMPEEYPAIKELFDIFVEKLGEQVVLRKKE